MKNVVLSFEPPKSVVSSAFRAILFTILIAGFARDASAQLATASYETRSAFVSSYPTDCRQLETGTLEYSSFMGTYDDAIAAAQANPALYSLEYHSTGCQQCDATSGACTYNQSVNMMTNRSTNTGTLTFTARAFEWDNSDLVCGTTLDRCSINQQACSDCQKLESQTVSFRTAVPVVLNNTSNWTQTSTYGSTNNHAWAAQYRWRYSGTSAEAITPGCDPVTVNVQAGNVRSWTVYMEAGKTYSFSTCASEDFYLPTALRVINTNGYSLLTIFNNSTSCGSYGAEGTYTATSTGLHYLEMYCENASGGGRQVLTPWPSGFGNTVFRMTYYMVDSEPPVVNCATNDNVTVNAGANCQYTFTGLFGALALSPSSITDNCTDFSDFSSNPSTWTRTPSGNTFDIGVTNVTISATDDAGNTGSCSFTVTVEEDTPPSIICPANATRTISSGCTYTFSGISGAAALYPASFSDNCTASGDINLSRSPSTSTFLAGTTTVTWTAEDESGNTASCNFTVTVNETTPPSITCPASQTVNADANCQFTYSGLSLLTLNPISYSDNCTITPLISRTRVPSSNTFSLGTTVVTWTATDQSGNSRSCSFNVIVQDNTGPVVTCPSNLTVNTSGADCSTTINDAALSYTAVTDNCSAAAAISTSRSPLGNTFDAGTTTVTWSATDEAGNIGSCSFPVTVRDNGSPSITCPSNAVRNADANCQYTFGFGQGNFIFPSDWSDNCTDHADIQLSNNYGSSTFYLGTTTVTWTAEDESGNTATCSFNVRIDDVTAPIISCPTNQTVDAGANCEYTIPEAVLSPTGYSDFCTPSSAINLSRTPSSNTFSLGTTQVVWTASDASGNSNTCSFNVTVQESTAPTIICPSNLTVNTGSSCQATISSAALNYMDVLDNCSAATDISTSRSPLSNTFDLGATAVTWTATDENGNTCTCTFTVTVQDVTRPSITCPSDVVKNAEANCQYTFAGLGEGSLIIPIDWSDNCTDHDYIQVNGSYGSATFNLGTTTVTWTAEDESGNTATCNFNVTIRDVEIPEIFCPSSLTVDAGANCQYNFTGTDLEPLFYSDNCTAQSAIDLSRTPSSNTFNIGTTPVIWTASDASGNSGSCGFNVTVQETTAPTIICPSDLTTNTGSSCQATLSNAALLYTALSDNCSAASTISTSRSPSVNTFDLGATEVTWTATDESGNTGSCTYTVTVVDNRPPSITCRSDFYRVENSNCQFTFGGDIGSPSMMPTSLSDNCTAEYNIQLSRSPNTSTFNVGSTTVTWTAEDESGNTATCSFRVNILDNEEPDIFCPANLTVDAGANCQYTFTETSDLEPLFYSDNCTSVSALEVFRSSSSNTFSVGTTQVRWTAVDESDNAGTCIFNVTVHETAAPSITCPADITVDADAGCQATLDDASLSYTGLSDNCTLSADISTSRSPLDNTFDLGTTAVTWSATDALGNTGSCSFNVTVEDNTAPVLTCPETMIRAETEPGLCSAVVEYTFTAEDNCGIDNLEVSHPSGSALPQGLNTVTITATDASGNAASCEFFIGVQDFELPVVECQDVTVYLLEDGTPDLAPYEAATMALTSATDNCGIQVNLGYDQELIFDCSSVGEILTHVAKLDNSFNLSEPCWFTVTLADTLPPTVSCPADITVDSDPGLCGAVVSYEATAGDNCGAVLTASHPSGSVFEVGTTTVILTAADESGNTAVCTFDVTVEDTEAPELTCPSAIAAETDPGQCSAVVEYAFTTGDNCGAVVSSSHSSGLAFNVGTTTVTLTADDESGNTSVCTFEVTVTDTELPVIGCQGVTIYIREDGTPSMTAVQVSEAAVTYSSDNCALANGIIYGGPATMNCSLLGSTTVFVQRKDVSNNKSQKCWFTLTILDTLPPVAVCQDITVQLEADGTASVTPGDVDGGSSDNCDLTYSLTGQTTYTCEDLGFTYPVQLTVADASGNSVSCSASVTVADVNLYCNQPPVAVCQDVTVSTKFNCLAFGSIDNGTFDPDGDEITITLSPAGPYPLGTTDVTLTVTDPSGESDVCTATITVVDDITPTAVCLDITVQLDSDGSAVVTSGDIDGGSTDNCGISSIFIPKAGINGLSVDCSNVGVNNIALQVEDIAGNSSTCISVVTVEDNEAPVAICQDVTVQLDATGNGNTTTTAVDNGSNDACGIQSIALSQTAFTCSEVGANTVTLTATDNNNNVSTCTATVTVEDNIAPVAICQDVTVQLDASGNGSTTVAAVDNGSNDACGIQSIALSQTAFTCSEVGTNTVTLTVTDNNNNVSTCTATVTVGDNVAPVAICQDVTVQLDATGNGSTSASAIDNGSNDACGIAGLSATPINFDCSHLGSNSVTLTVTDNNGNSSTCTATVEVIGVVPVVSISESLQPALCQGGTIVLTAHSDVEVQAYLWSTGETSSSIQANEDGNYSVEVTSLTGCVSSASYEVSGYDAGSLLSSYTILSTKGDVHLHGDNVVTSGGVGVMGSDRKAKLHDNVVVHTFVQAVEVDLNNNSSAAEIIWQPANPPLPPFINNPYAAENNVTVDEEEVAVLTECIYDKVDIKKDATVTFTCENIFIHELKTQDGVTIDFSGPTNLFINKKVKLKKENSFNPQAATVTVYVDESFEVDEGSDVTAQVYATKDVKAEGKSDKPTTMTGIFIGDKVEGKDFVTWNWDINCDPAPAPNLPEPCDACKGGVTQMDLIYNGTDTAQVTVTGENGVPVYFSGVVAPGETITVFGVIIGEKLDKEAEIYVDGVLHAQVHTSGSQPIGPGLVLGDFTMVYAECKDNDDPICPIGQNLARVAMSSEPTEQKMLQALENEAYPNPFNAEATIRFTVPESAVTVVEVISLNGELVQRFEMGMLEAGRPHEIKLIAGEDWVSGVYHYRIISGKYTANGNMVYLK